MAGQLSQLRQANPNMPTLLGSDSWHSPELDLAAAAGSYFTTHFFLEDHQAQTQPWAEAYKAAYAVAPDTLAALGYDAATILLQAIQQAGTLEVKAVAKTLEEGRFETITGPITFDDQHNPIKPAPVLQVKDGQVSLVEYVPIE
jgi:branched-chain amino acid transport system substrate-binding protein